MNCEYEEQEAWKTFWFDMTGKGPWEIELIMTGSCAELDAASYCASPSDIDFMFYLKDLLAVTVDEVVPKSYKGRIIRHTLNSEGTHPGYTKIEPRDCVSIESIFKGWTVFQKDRSSPARKVVAEWFQCLSAMSSIDDVDVIFSIRSQGWPATASEWVTRRRRPSGWPTTGQIEAIVNGGYHLIDKTHPHHTKQNVFWRISFSTAEAALVRSWSREQKCIYHNLRILKQKVVAACGSSKPVALSTYIFKTAMLWECEQRLQDFWNVRKMAEAFHAVVCTVIEWLIDKRCPNYFIPSNNMLDHLPDSQDFNREVQLLLVFTETEFPTPTMEQLTPVTNSQSLLDCAVNVGRSIYTLPPWMQTHCMSELPVHENCLSGQQNENQKVHDELKHLYSALTGSQLRIARLNRSEQLSDPEKDNWDIPEEYFLRALQSAEGQTGRRDRTVNSTVYVCAAYLANFYLVVKRNFAQTRDVCSTILAKRQDLWLTWVSEFSYPVLLSTEWSEIFDERVQAVLGLCVLHERFACENKGLGRWKILIKICPMVFLHYINVQCLLRLGNKHDLQSAIEDLKHHLYNNCPSDRHSWSTSDDLSRSVILTVLHISLQSTNHDSWCIQRKEN